MGETPKSHINNAPTIGIQKFVTVIFAALAILNVGAAISATTAGRIPLNMLSTVLFSLKFWKNRAIPNIIRKEGKMVPKVHTILPHTPFSL